MDPTGFIQHLFWNNFPMEDLISPWEADRDYQDAEMEPETAATTVPVVSSDGVLVGNFPVKRLPTWKFNSSPLKFCHSNRKVVFQPPIFKGYVKLRGCKVATLEDFAMMQGSWNKTTKNTLKTALPETISSSPLKIEPWKRRFLWETTICGAMLVSGRVIYTQETNL